MNKPNISIFICFLIALLATVGIAADKHNFNAHLTGGEVVGEVHTDAMGEATFQLSKDGNELKYKLIVNRIENVTAAHIHEGKHGKNGPPVASLFSGPKKAGKFSGTLSEGSITAKDLFGSLKGKPLSSLMKMIEDKDAYVNVHSEKYPDGEVRGQIMPD